MLKEYTRLMDQAVEAAVRGKRFPSNIRGYCPHCREELSPTGHHLPDSEWEDDLCRTVVSSYADLLQMVYDNPFGPDLARIDKLIAQEKWYKFISTVFFIKRSPGHSLRMARLKEYSAKMHILNA